MDNVPLALPKYHDINISLVVYKTDTRSLIFTRIKRSKFSSRTVTTTSEFLINVILFFREMTMSCFSFAWKDQAYMLWCHLPVSSPCNISRSYSLGIVMKKTAKYLFIFLQKEMHSSTFIHNIFPLCVKEKYQNSTLLWLHICAPTELYFAWSHAWQHGALWVLWLVAMWLMNCE